MIIKTSPPTLFSIGLASPTMLAAVYGSAPLPRGFLGFLLLGGPLLGLFVYLQPILGFGSPFSPLVWPRSVTLKSLISPLELISRLSALIGYGLRLSHLSISMVLVCNFISRTLANCNSSSASSSHQSFRLMDLVYLGFRYAIRLENNGIMISSLRRGGYRNFFNPLSPNPLNIESEPYLSNIFKIDIHESKDLRSYGIMRPALWSSAYQMLLNSIPLNPPGDRTHSTPLLVDDHFLLNLPGTARISTLRIFSMSPHLLWTVTITSSTALFVDDVLTTRALTGTSRLRSIGPQVSWILCRFIFAIFV
ncbi:hypothetical protein AtNW77_Chr5g0117351 [Arabidopsis thaliana]|uniref:Uncharacterized protein n=6 Tax=Arabidopsis TaxID=3701 RepID=A0A178U9N6_ARATH|nr:hypothetical protein At5g35890 [Arabidopsis thaliana]OAO90536.1 hypothetical protein AXX17_AT5G33210 [Arabidopsis thaliana]CAA0405678.1 unnamed protein product [Arabidopsis thaliana]VYS68379.1 unnamed protein product [Arabidopsis thaliana]